MPFLIRVDKSVCSLCYLFILLQFTLTVASFFCYWWSLVFGLLCFFFSLQFDLWTDSQRKRFLDVVFRQCTRSQNKFVQDWFRERVPMQHLDFTTVLPRFLSLYIFSFLEPKSLSRCAQASWTWKFLSEQVWIF